jgi:glycosyltransferase involved in cell wall biosynthesis
MHLLFIHQAFPAQFGHLALELTRRYGWRCRFLVQHLSGCPLPTPEMLRAVAVQVVPAPHSDEPGPWSERLARQLSLAAIVQEAARALPGPPPDLIVGHCGLGPTLFLSEVFSCPLVHYCEYFLGGNGRDLDYRADLPATEPAPYFPRCINAATLLSLAASPHGYTPTHWQRESFPARFRSNIEVHFDGLDTTLYRPREVGAATIADLLGGRQLPPGTRLVTFAARGLESMRGFDLFLQVAGRIARARPDVLFAVAGDENAYYGWDALFTGTVSFKEWALARIDCDRDRLVFLGHLDPDRLALLLARSDLHLYLTVPFVLSWSFLDALACGCTVLAADVPPVREVLQPGVHGLVEPLFDVDRLTATALRVLADPAAFRPLGRAAREHIEGNYGLEATIPALKDYFERRASSSPRPLARVHESAR